MTAQRELFPDPDKPCTTCKGSGVKWDATIITRNEPRTRAVGQGVYATTCLSCGGTGRAQDQSNPDTNPFPEGY